MPRLLIQVVYKEGQNFHIGELDKLISITSEKNNDEAIRDISEVKVDVTNLVNTFSVNKDKIGKMRLIVDERIKFVNDKQDSDIKTSLNKLTVEDLVF